LGLKNNGYLKDKYFFGIARAKGNKKRYDAFEVDYFAFVALDSKKIAYLSSIELFNSKGLVLQTIIFRTRDKEYKRVINEKSYDSKRGKYIEDYFEFKNNAVFSEETFRKMKGKMHFFENNKFTSWLLKQLPEERNIHDVFRIIASRSEQEVLSFYNKFIAETSQLELEFNDNPKHNNNPTWKIVSR